MKLLGKLHIQVLIALVAAAILGIVAPHAAVAMKPLGDLFIGLLRMLLAPIVFCTVVHGLSHTADMRRLGRLGWKTLLYFEILSTIGMALGFLAINVFRPGAGLHAVHLDTSVAVAHVEQAASQMTVMGFVMGLVPHTLVGAFADGNILQVLLIAMLAGIALNLSVGPDSALARGVGEGQRVLFTILGFVMRLAPIGAFGAMAAAVGSYGGVTLLYLLKLVVLYWATSLVFIFLVLGVVTARCGVSIFSVLRFMREELLLVLGTASGEVAFPRLVQKLGKAGCDEVVVGFVLPAGYSFNLDGTSIYMALSVGFLAQATDTPFTLTQQLGLLAVLTLTSRGGTTVAGGAFIKLAATMQSVKALPLGGLGLLFGIDRLMATATALTNMIGNVVAVIALARWEKGFDVAQFRAYQHTPADVTVATVAEAGRTLEPARGPARPPVGLTHRESAR